jgi:extracellular elastinolytic metalloproteinase
MIGNMSGPLAGAIGEGMSDVLAIYVNDNDVVGEYSANDVDGIRSQPYDGYTRTYGDHAGSSVHSDGEIYAATMWRLKELWEGSGRTMNELFDVVIDGMNYTASRPANEDMRDGLLATPKSDATEECLIWDAFAELGVGVGAQGTETCFWIFCFGSDTTESFDLPTQCQ